MAEVRRAIPAIVRPPHIAVGVHTRLLHTIPTVLAPTLAAIAVTRRRTATLLPAPTPRLPRRTIPVVVARTTVAGVPVGASMAVVEAGEAMPAALVLTAVAAVTTNLNVVRILARSDETRGGLSLHSGLSLFATPRALPATLLLPLCLYGVMTGFQAASTSTSCL
jgi:hypothetical protein